LVGTFLSLLASISPEELWLSSTYRFVFIVFGGFLLLMAFVWWLIRGIVEIDDTLLYWFVSGGDPYIFDADKRSEHFTFKSWLSIAFGVPFILTGILVPDDILVQFGILGVGAVAVSGLILRLLFVADAADKNKEEEHGEEGEQAEIEKMLLDEEQGRLRD